MRHLAAFLMNRKKPAGAPTDFVQGILVHRKQIAQLWFPTDSDEDLLPAPTPEPHLAAEFGELASAVISARRLPQLHRVRNLYRDGTKITQFFPYDKGKNTQKPCTLCFLDRRIRVCQPQREIVPSDKAGGTRYQDSFSSRMVKRNHPSSARPSGANRLPLIIVVKPSHSSWAVSV